MPKDEVAKIELTEEQIDQVFASWVQDHRDNPKEFLSVDELDKMEVEKVAKLDTTCFIKNAVKLGFVKVTAPTPS